MLAIKAYGDSALQSTEVLQGQARRADRYVSAGPQYHQRVDFHASAATHSLRLLFFESFRDALLTDDSQKRKGSDIVSKPAQKNSGLLDYRFPGWLFKRGLTNFEL